MHLNRICANYELTGRANNYRKFKRTYYQIYCMLMKKKFLLNLFKNKLHYILILKLSDMSSSRRSINIARPRQIAMYLCKEITSFSYPEIGKAFGGKDHTTVMHAVKKIVCFIIADLKLQKNLIDLKN